MTQNWMAFVDKPLERLMSGWMSTLTTLHAVASLNSMVTENTSFARCMQDWAASDSNSAKESQADSSNSKSKSTDLALQLGMCDGLISQIFADIDEKQQKQMTTSLDDYWLVIMRQAHEVIQKNNRSADEMVLSN
jgi:hypothetical protein